MHALPLPRPPGCGELASDGAETSGCVVGLVGRLGLCPRRSRATKYICKVRALYLEPRAQCEDVSTDAVVFGAWVIGWFGRRGSRPNAWQRGP
eukprot:6568986-Pyramimonas_sp.AAC.1